MPDAASPLFGPDQALTIAGLGLVALVAGGLALLAAAVAVARARRAALLAACLADGEPGARQVIDADGRVLVANAAARALCGRRGRLPDLLASRLATGDGAATGGGGGAGGEDDRDRSATGLERLRAAAAGGAVDRADLALLAPAAPEALAGSGEWWQASVRPAPGLPGACLWAAEDVTARRVIEDVLVREREELAEFLYCTPVGLYSADADGSLRFVNQRLAEWLGEETPEALAGVALADLMADGEPPGAEGGWQGRLSLRARSGEAFAALAIQAVYDDAGETRTRTVVLRPDLLGDGLNGAGGGAGRAEDDGEGGARFRWLFTGAPVGQCMLDLDGVVSDCNPAFLRLSGLDRSMVVDHALHDLLHPDDRGDLDALMQAVALGESEGVHREVRLAVPPASGAAAEPVASLFIAPLGGGAGIDGLVAHFLDTTAQRTLEAQFAQAQKMQAMGQLAGGVAHDFNNLLTAMIGFCDLLLQRHGPGDPSFADLMQIKQNANRAANLVRQLLAFSRKQPLRPRLLDVTEALSEMTHLLRRLLGEAVQLDLRHGRDVGLVRVDPGQFDQVIVNLAVNARDAMPGGGRLAIRTRVETVVTPYTRGPEQVPAGTYVAVSVADGGVGIARENLGRIFEPFFSTKSGAVGAGTGLGLATVYGIIRQTGGFVFVDSTPGSGTEFTILLPRHEAAATPESPAGTAAEPPPTAPAAPERVGGTVLLVEDEDPVRVFAARALRNKGYTVLEARTGEGALEVLAGTPAVDVLITDMVMPGMDGATLARTVRAERPEIRVVVISGYSEEAARGELTESVDFHFLPKPFSLGQLAAKVKDVMLESPGG